MISPSDELFTMRIFIDGTGPNKWVAQQRIPMDLSRFVKRLSRAASLFFERNESHPANLKKSAPFFWGGKSFYEDIFLTILYPKAPFPFAHSKVFPREKDFREIALSNFLSLG